MNGWKMFQKLTFFAVFGSYIEKKHAVQRGNRAASHFSFRHVVYNITNQQNIFMSNEGKK